MPQIPPPTSAELAFMVQELLRIAEGAMTKLSGIEARLAQLETLLGVPPPSFSTLPDNKGTELAQTSPIENLSACPPSKPH
jgi:hypothetical protein